MVTQAAQRVDGWLSGIPFHPWLFAAFPVVRLYSENLTEAEPGELVLPLLVVLGATTVGMAVLGLLVRDQRRAGIIVSAILVPVLSFGLIREAMPASLELSDAVLLVVSVAFVVLAVVVALRVRGQLGPLTSALNILSAVLIIIVAIPTSRAIVDVLSTQDDLGISGVVTLAAAAPAASPTRDIYHIILDRYGSERSLETGFDIDNSEFIEWLRAQGFQVVDDAHANYAWTTSSVASTLRMAHLDDIARKVGESSVNLRPMIDLIRSSRAGAFLQDLGYEYVHVGSYFNRTRDSKIADRVFDAQDTVTFASTFTDLTLLPELLGTEGTAMDRPATHAATAISQFDYLARLRDEPGPKYVLAHILLPHPPSVFLEDGTYDPESATLESQIGYTNRKLKEFLEPILALPEDERPIVILQADEGPYPRRLARDDEGFEWEGVTDDELVTKFGILDAWLMPGAEGEAPLPVEQTAVNTYPELFRRYFGADIADVPDRIYVAGKAQPYALTDVTERLAAAEAALAAEPSSSPSTETPAASTGAVPASVAPPPSPLPSHSST